MACRFRSAASRTVILRALSPPRCRRGSGEDCDRDCGSAEGEREVEDEASTWTLDSGDDPSRDETNRAIPTDELRT